VDLAKKYDKQVILTTHNPAILDGLNLDDEEAAIVCGLQEQKRPDQIEAYFKAEGRGRRRTRPAVRSISKRLSRRPAAELLDMKSLGLISEGITDQVVIENILLGYFDTDEVDLRPLSPLRDETDQNSLWAIVAGLPLIGYVKSSQFNEAFQYQDFLIVHIDRMYVKRKITMCRVAKTAES